MHVIYESTYITNTVHFLQVLAIHTAFVREVHYQRRLRWDITNVCVL